MNTYRVRRPCRRCGCGYRYNDDGSTNVEQTAAVQFMRGVRRGQTEGGAAAAVHKYAALNGLLNSLSDSGGAVTLHGGACNWQVATDLTASTSRHPHVSDLIERGHVKPVHSPSKSRRKVEPSCLTGDTPASRTAHFGFLYNALPTSLPHAPPTIAAQTRPTSHPKLADERMEQSLLNESINDSALADATIDTLTVQSCRHLPLDHPLTPKLLDSPSVNLRRPRVFIDWIISVAANSASMYGFGYLVWCKNSPTPPASLTTSPYLPVPILNPFASQQGYGVVGRGSMLIDNAITTLVMTTLVVVIQGFLVSLAVSRAHRPPIHPATVGRPLSYFSSWRYRTVGSRIVYTLLQFAAPWILFVLVAMCVLCGAVGGGLGECSLETETAIWLKVVWCVPFYATLYPLVNVGAINVNNLKDARLQRYIETVREQHAKGDIDLAV